MCIRDRYNMIDTHSHLFVEEFDEDLPAVLERARDSGVSKVFMPHIDDTSKEADAYFPEIKKEEWKETGREDHPTDEKTSLPV